MPRENIELLIVGFIPDQTALLDILSKTLNPKSLGLNVLDLRDFSLIKKNRFTGLKPKGGSTITPT